MSDERNLNIEDDRRLQQESRALVYGIGVTMSDADMVWQLVRKAYLSGYDRRQLEEQDDE